MDVFFYVSLFILLLSCTNHLDRSSSAIDAHKNSLDNPWTVSPPKQSNQVIEKIAFESCNHQDRDQSIWNAIREYQANLWIWTGDAVYANTSDPQKMRATYSKQLSRDEYLQFVKTKTPVIGTLVKFGKNFDEI